MAHGDKSKLVLATFEANPLLNSCELGEMIGVRSEYVRTVLRRAGKQLHKSGKRRFMGRASLRTGKRGSEKLYMKVLDALNEGAETSDQVAAMTGLSVKKASAHLFLLRREGLARIVKRDARRFHNRGRASHTWGPA